MFIKKELSKKINELCYKRHSKVDSIKGLLPVNIETPNLFLDLLQGDLILFTRDNELPDMIEDMIHINNYGIKGLTKPSPATSKLITELSKVSISVEQRLFSIKRPLSDTFYEVVNLLKTSENSCVVGGCVRDIILGNNPEDIDFVTDIDYDTLEFMFKKAGFKVQSEGKQFLVCIVSKNGEQYEVANYRKDGTYADGRRPESVSIGNIDEDALRRDLTVNALYYNLTTNQVLDPTGQGIIDINNKVLRFVGKPSERLAEDYLRGWRFLRFLKKLEGFEAHPKSLRSVRENWDSVYKKTNPQRVLQEISKIVGL